MFNGLFCLESELLSSAEVCEAWDVSDPYMAKADATERWITLKPHGANSDHYQHVKVRVNPDGTAHILNGPSELRGLRLTRLASKEELASRQKERAAKRAEAVKKQKAEQQERAKNDPEFARQLQEKEAQSQQKSEARKQLEAEIHETLKGLLSTAGDLTGDASYGVDLDSAKDQVRAHAMDALAEHNFDAKTVKGAANLVHSQNMRSLKSSLKAVRKGILRNMIESPELRGAVLGEDELDVSELQKTHPSGHPGYQQNSKRQAEDRGFTSGDAKAEAEQVFESRVKALGDQAYHDAISSGLPAEQAEQRRAQVMGDSLKAREALQNRAQAASEMGGARIKPSKTVSSEALQQKAEKTKAFLEQHNRLQELERKLRSLDLQHDPEATPEEEEALESSDQPVKGADLGVEASQVAPDFAARLEAELKNVEQEDITRAFLNSVDEDGQHVGYADELIRRAMHAHIGTGAYAHFANVSLNALGTDALDRQVVDALGVEASAQILAHMLHRNLTSDQLEQTVKGLGVYHDQTSIQRMKEAMAVAEAARTDAASLELPPINSSTDAALVHQLNKSRKERIQEAQSALGTALGAVEAGAALNFSLKNPPKNITVDFGREGDTQKVITQLRALGLQDGDYEVERTADLKNPNNDKLLKVTIHPSGIDRLTPPLDPESQQNAQIVKAIKSGQEDQQGWLPAGFVERAPSDYIENPEMPPAFAAPPDFSKGIDGAIRDVVASRFADGWTASEIFTHLMDNVSQNVPEGQAEAFSKKVSELFPFVQSVEKKAKDGSTYMDHEAVDLDSHPDVQRRLQSMSREWLSENHPGHADFHSQHIVDDPKTREALFQTITQNPALLSAFVDPADIGGDKAGRGHAKAIRGYFFNLIKSKFGGKDIKTYDAEQAKAKSEALQKLGDSPQKWGAFSSDSLFGDPAPVDPKAPVKLTFSPHASPEERVSALQQYGLNIQHYTMTEDGAVLNDAGKEALTPPGGSQGMGEVITGGLDGLNPDWVRHQRKEREIHNKFRTSTDHWHDFVETNRGPRNAYRAVQEVMQSELIREFHTHHAQSTGKALKLSKQTTQHWERRLAAMDPQKAQEIRARDQKMMESLRERDSTGRYLGMGEGGLVGAVQQHVEKMRRQSQLQGGFGFDLFGSQGGGETTTEQPHHLEVGEHERYSLGHAAESRLKQMLKTDYGISPTGAPVSLIKGLSWSPGTKHVHKQRAVKMMLKTGRLLGFFGAGSGKTSMAIGGFTEAHAQGLASKGLFVVPSIVRNQFGEEMTRFTEPGKYHWHAGESSFEERLSAYQSPHTHMVVSTHQTFRDDMVKLMGAAHNLTPEKVAEHFSSLPRPERAAMLKRALEHHKIPMDYFSIDEAHEALNRAGKQESLLSQVVEAAMDNSKIKSQFTGSPFKNDASEGFDWLAKIDPKRFSDRDAFLRKYGVDTQASREALQRLMDQYSYVDAVTPDVNRKVIWGHEKEDGQHSPLPLTPKQREAYDGVLQAYDQARKAVKAGRVDVQAAKVLSPNAFKDVPEEQHHDVAAKVHSALGTAKFSALNRVVNDFDPEHNAKIQHVLGLASARKGKGGVIFAHNKASLAALKETLEAQGHKVGLIDGTLNGTKKAQVRQQFDQGHIDIVLCSDAGAVGANLQKRGEWLVNFDLPLTQKTLEQRNARIDRLGQQKNIELHHLQSDTEYDQDNYKRLERKRQLGSILQGEYKHMDDTGLARYIMHANDHYSNAAD